MCGRYSLSSPLAELVETFGVESVVLRHYRPRYNIAPTQEAPVLVRGPSGGLRLGALFWGLPPSRVHASASGNRVINARSENAYRQRPFREAFRFRRCLVPADGFYEWRRVTPADPVAASPLKQPYWVHRPDRRPVAFAGLWERSSAPGGDEPLVSFAILTTVPSPSLAFLHDRMPALLPPEAWARWLDPLAEPEALRGLLGPAPEGLLEAWPVSTRVNRPEFDDPACIREVPEGGRTPARGQAASEDP